MSFNCNWPSSLGHDEDGWFYHRPNNPFMDIMKCLGKPISDMQLSRWVSMDRFSMNTNQLRLFQWDIYREFQRHTRLNEYDDSVS